MKRLVLAIAFLSCAGFFIPTYASCAAPNAKPFYIAVKPGIYSPQTSDLDGFNTGFSGDLAFGYRYNPNFAAELSAGYFHTDSTSRVSGTILGIPVSASEKDNIDVVPVTLTLKGILPVDRWEFFVLGGIGAYFVATETKVRLSVAGATTSDKATDNSTVFGGFAGLGFHYNITPAWFVGAEGKYLWTSKVSLDETLLGSPVSGTFKLDGILANAVIGFKF
jgi:opacity protein-like surface antigen